MKKIKLTKGKYALVDDEDFDYLNQWRWCDSHGYAMRSQYLGGGRKNGKSKSIFMHRVVMKVEDKNTKDIDHINRNRADNRKSNLRFCTPSQNLANSKLRTTNKSGYSGIRFSNRYHKFEVRIKKEGKAYTKVFENLKKAIKWQKEKYKELFGEFSPI